MALEIPASARQRARSQLERELGPSRVITDPQACAEYASDESEAQGQVPDAVVLAERAEHVTKALAVARETGVPITPRAGGTGRSGGAVPVCGGILLATLGMNQIKEIDRRDGLAVVGPGVILSDLHAAAEKEGWFYPPDPNSVTGCALGGNVAENAGGPRAFKYGVTGDFVFGIEAFLIGGQRIEVGRRTIKGVTGYDVTHLLVGSEGTLAVFGDLTLRLVPRPQAIHTLLALFSDVRQAGQAVVRIVASGFVPRCLELLDSGTLQAMRDAGNPLDPRAGAMLIIEVDGDERSCDEQERRVGDVCSELGAIDIEAARSDAERERIWAARRDMSAAVRKLARHKLSEDVVVPRQSIPELLDRVGASCERERVRWVAYGHAGDGNLHVNFLWNEDDERLAVHRAIERLFHDVVELRGTLSGEHGIGVLKAPYLAIEQSPELIALQQQLKSVFDPQGLLNPGKIFAARGHRDC